MPTAASTTNSAGSSRRGASDPERSEREPPGAFELVDEQARDQEPAEHEEEVDAEEAARRDARREVVQHDREHRDAAQPVESTDVAHAGRGSGGWRSGRALVGPRAGDSHRSSLRIHLVRGGLMPTRATPVAAGGYRVPSVTRGLIMAKRDYKLVSADSHLGLPPGFFQTLPAGELPRPRLGAGDRGRLQAVLEDGGHGPRSHGRQALRGLQGEGHHRGRHPSRRVRADGAPEGHGPRRRRRRGAHLGRRGAERRGHRRRLPARGDPVVQQLPLGVLPGRPRAPHRPGDGAVRQPRAGAGGDEAGVEAARHPRLPVRRLPEP